MVTTDITAIEDRMTKLLTFKADKSKIKIALTKGDKTYTLKDNEYNLQTIGSNVSADVKKLNMLIVLKILNQHLVSKLKT